MAESQDQSKGMDAGSTRSRRLRTNTRTAVGAEALAAPAPENLALSWFHRHQHPFNFWIHMLGIPLAVAGAVLLIVEWESWWWGLGGLTLGYALQWLGHHVEGNDVGEWAAIKRLLGFEAVAISPRYRQTAMD
jgi:hypothetical protein